MIAATQLGLVPPEIKSEQESIFASTDQVRRSWPSTKAEYKSEDVRRIATSMNKSISVLIDALVNAASDSIVRENTALLKQFDVDVVKLQKFQRALALVVEQSRAAGEVHMAELRSAIPAMMEQVANIWKSANATHDLFLGWISQSQAEEIAQGYQDILAVVLTFPGAKQPPGFLSRHRRKIYAGVVLLGAGGVATAWLIGRRRSMMHGHDDEALPAAELKVPVGVHFFRSSEDDEQLLLSDGRERSPSPVSEVAAMLKNIS